MYARRNALAAALVGSNFAVNMKENCCDELDKNSIFRCQDSNSKHYSIYRKPCSTVTLVATDGQIELFLLHMEPVHYLPIYLIEYDENCHL